MKKYSEELLQALKAGQTATMYYGLEVLVKNLPDSDTPGAMDARLYADSKKNLEMLSHMPKMKGTALAKLAMGKLGLSFMRKSFNGLKSIPCVERKIEIQNRAVKASDGFSIPVRVYHSDTPKENSPILYYIHGGGFFGGSPDVVEESIKMLVAKTDFCAVSVEYRLAPENAYPRGHKDCFETLEWVYQNAEALGGDPARIFVAGDSAGGNLAQYCSTRDRENGGNMVRGQMLLYPTLNMAQVEDEYFHPSIDQFEMAPDVVKGLSKMIGMFGGMTGGIRSLLRTEDVHNDYLNPYTRDPKNNPATFVAVGEHDFLKLETLGYAAKLHKAGVDTTAVLYKGFGHAFFDNTGVYPQCEDCIDEMIAFMKKHS